MSSILDATTSTDADYAMRNWQGAETGRIVIGSDAHMRLFCRMLLDTHNPYKPAIMVWPKLAPDALQRITSLPIWDIAVQTEGRAMLRARAYADTVRDPLLHEALSLDAGEEARHKVVLSHLVQSYGIPLEPEPEYEMPEDPEWDWLVTGYSE
ncbi:MAG: ferritin-like domain-containing protein, partial [Rhodanobacteraceae bacterium]